MSVDALCRDGTGQISRDQHTKMPPNSGRMPIWPRLQNLPEVAHKTIPSLYASNSLHENSLIFDFTIFMSASSQVQ